MHEIERKFITTSSLAHNFIYNEFSPIEKFQIEQHYIESSKEKEIRVRKKVFLSKDQVKYYKTIKTGHGLVREEIENEISKEEFETLALKAISSITKERIQANGIEFDFYQGLNQGLVTFEIEFSSIEESKKELPETVKNIILLEVTGNKKYSNLNLSQEKVDWISEVNSSL